MLEPIPNSQQWERGPRIVAIGGGTGLVHHAAGAEKLYPEPHRGGDGGG